MCDALVVWQWRDVDGGRVARRQVPGRELAPVGQRLRLAAVRVQLDVGRQLLLHQQRHVFETFQSVFLLVAYLQQDDVVTFV